MAWGTVLKTFIKGSAKKISGKKMARNFMRSKKEKDNSSAIIIRKKSTTLAPMLGGGDSQDISIKKPTKKH